MKTFVKASAMAVVLGTSIPAYAATPLATSSIYGSTSQTDAVCYVRNIGTKNLVGSVVRIYDGSGADVTDVDGCAASFAPGQTCAVLALSISSSSAHSCSAFVKGGEKSARGTLEIRDNSAGETVRAEELR